MNEETSTESAEPRTGPDEVIHYLAAAVVSGYGVHWAAATGYVFVPGVNGYPIAFPARPLEFRPHH